MCVAYQVEDKERRQCGVGLDGVGRHCGAGFNGGVVGFKGDVGILHRLHQQFNHQTRETFCYLKMHQDICWFNATEAFLCV